MTSSMPRSWHPKSVIFEGFGHPVLTSYANFGPTVQTSLFPHTCDCPGLKNQLFTKLKPIFDPSDASDKVAKPLKCNLSSNERLESGRE